MQVHLFGGTSSPSCAAYALKRTVIDKEDLFEPEVAATGQRNFYVDRQRIELLSLRRRSDATSGHWLLI
jgi:hypothetical protein